MPTGPSTQAYIGMKRACCSMMASRWSAGILSARPDSSIWAFMNSRASIFCIQTPVKPRTRTTYTTSGTRKRGLRTMRAKASRGEK